MPRRTPRTTLGFIGTGDVSAKATQALLDDFLEAQEADNVTVIVPATEAHWGDGIETVADLALERGWTLEVITDDTTAKFRGVKEYIPQASKSHKAAKVPVRLAQLLSEAHGTLMVLWDDEDEAAYEALEHADKEKVDSLDLCSGLQPLTLTEDVEPEVETPKKSRAKAKDEEQPDDVVTMAWLKEKSDGEIEAMADDLGIDVEPFDTWDEVRQAIFDFKQEENEPQTELEAGGHDDEEEFEPDAATDTTFEPEEETDEGLELPADDDEPTARVVGAYVECASLSDEALEQIQGIVDEALGAAIKATIAALGSKETLKSVTEALAAQQEGKSVPTKTTAAKKTATKKAAPAKKATATKRIPAHNSGEARPLDAHLKLLGKKLTKAQAQEILDTVEEHPFAGRPTNDESKLIAQAKALIPDPPKRGRGRPAATPAKAPAKKAVAKKAPAKKVITRKK